MRPKLNPLDDLLQDLPTPRLSETRKNELQTKIMTHYDQVHNKEAQAKRRGWMKTLQIGVGSLAGLAIIAIFMISVIPHSAWTHSGETAKMGSVAPPLNQNDYIIEHKTYATASKAAQVLADFQAGSPSFGKPINIGSGIQASVAKSGQTYDYKWIQGKWSVLFKGAQDEKSGARVAQTISHYLATANLPIPNQTGLITLTKPTATASANPVTIAWRTGQTVYSIKATSRVVQDLEAMIGTANQPTKNPYADLSAKALGQWFVDNGTPAPFAGTQVKQVKANQFVMNLRTGTLIQPSNGSFNPQVSQVIDQWEGVLNGKPFGVDLYQNVQTKNTFVGVTFNNKEVAAYSCQATTCSVHNFTGSYIVFAAANGSGSYFSINVQTGEVVPPSESKLNLELAGIDPAQPTNATVGITGSTPANANTNQPNPFQTSVTLPNGNVVVPNQPAQWNGLTIQVVVTSLPIQSASPDKYREIVGNHSTVKQHETVQTTVGQTDLVWNQSSQPAASGSTSTTNDYWLIAYGSQYAYAIKATFTGNPSTVRSDLLQLSKKWQVPK